MIPILVKSDDIRSGRNAKVRYGRHRSQWGNINLKKDNSLKKLKRLLNLELTKQIHSIHGKQVLAIST